MQRCTVRIGVCAPETTATRRASAQVEGRCKRELRLLQLTVAAGAESQEQDAVLCSEVEHEAPLACVQAAAQALLPLLLAKAPPATGSAGAIPATTQAEWLLARKREAVAQVLEALAALQRRGRLTYQTGATLRAFVAGVLKQLQQQQVEPAPALQQGHDEGDEEEGAASAVASMQLDQTGNLRKALTGLGRLPMAALAQVSRTVLGSEGIAGRIAFLGNILMHKHTGTAQCAYHPLTDLRRPSQVYAYCCLLVCQRFIDLPDLDSAFEVRWRLRMGHEL